MQHEQTYEELKSLYDRLLERFTVVQNKYIDLQKRFQVVESVVLRSEDKNRQLEDENRQLEDKNRQLEDENQRLKETDHSRVDIQGNPYIVSTCMLQSQS